MKFKWMRIVAAALMLMLALPACGEEAAVEDGLYTIGVSSDSKMFKVVDCVLQVEDGEMTAVLTLSGTGYGYLYPGTAEEADAAPRETWIPFEEDDEGRYTYAVPIDALDADVPVAAYSTKYSKWYDRMLNFLSGSMTAYDKVSEDGAYDAAAASDVAALDGAACLIAVDGGRMTATLSGIGEGVAALDVGGGQVAVEGGECTLEIDSLDRRIPLSVDGEGGHWLRVDAAALSVHAVTPEDGVYAVEAVTDSGLLRFTSCTLTVSGGQMTAALTAKGGSYDYIYLGEAADARADEAGWIAAVPDQDGNYTYIVPVSALDIDIPVATYSTGKRMWYDRTLRLESDTLQRSEQ